MYGKGSADPGVAWKASSRFLGDQFSYPIQDISKQRLLGWKNYSLPQCPISQDSITSMHIHIASIPANHHDKSITSEEKWFNGTVGRQPTMPFEKYLEEVAIFTFENTNLAVMDIWLEGRVVEYRFR